MKTQMQEPSLNKLSHAQVDALVNSKTVKFGEATLTDFRSDQERLFITAMVASRKNGEPIGEITPFRVSIGHIGMDEGRKICLRRNGISTTVLLEVALSDVVLESGVSLDKVD